MSESEPQRKVALVGTSRVGKSEIIKILRKKYEGNSDVGFIEEAARIYFTLHPEIPVDIRFSYQPQSEIQELALRLEREAHVTSAKSLLSDRSVLDAPAYVRTYGDVEGSRKLVDRVRGWLPTYSAIVLLDPTDVPYEKDEVRLEDPEVRQRNHDGFVEMFMDESIPYILLGGDLNERVATVDGILMESKS